jgi:hypothetical protein
MSAKRSQLHKDQDAWEQQLLQQSGVASGTDPGPRQTVFDTEEEARVTLVVYVFCSISLPSFLVCCDLSLSLSLSIC